MFIQQNVATIVVAGILFCIVALIVRKIVSDKRSGVPCACSCKECPSAAICHPSKN